MKKNLYRAFLDLIFLAVFNVLFFLYTDAPRLTGVWISYALIHISYLLMLITLFKMRTGKSSAVMGMPLYTISFIFFLLEIIIGLVMIKRGYESIKTVVILQLVLTVGYAVLMLTGAIANEDTAEQEKRRVSELRYVKNAGELLRQMMMRAPDSRSKKRLERAYDLVSTSPSRSCPEAQRYEEAVFSAIEQLQAAIEDGDSEKLCTLADRILQNAEERNSIVSRSNS